MPTFNPKLAKAQKAIKSADITLLPHQVVGVKWLLERERGVVKGGLLADDMGLGKTVQIIAVILGNIKKVNLVVVPANIIMQWKSAIEYFAPSMNLIIHWGDSRINGGTMRKIETSTSSIVLTSYGLVSADSINKLEIDRLICDEAHTFRNSGTKVFRDLDKIHSKIRWALTGTPIQNRLKDLINIFKFVGYHGASKCNVDKLIETSLLRRTKDSLPIELPNIARQITMIKNLSKKDDKVYDMIYGGDLVDPDCELERLLRLRQASISTTMVIKSLEKSLGVDLSRYYTKNKKLDYIIRNLKENMDTDESKRFIIFTHFKYEIEYMSKKLKSQGIPYGEISGSVSMFDRNKVINDDSLKVLLIQIVSGGTGLNLQKYNYVYFTSPHWNPAMEDQALCRVYRIGQSQKVTIKHVICKETIESRIQEIQKEKNAIIDKHLA
jgi:SNF2 family DNA or RNA helicase